MNIRMRHWVSCLQTTGTMRYMRPGTPWATCSLFCLLHLVAELILTSISYLFLINALIDMWQKHANQKYNSQDFAANPRAEKKNKWVNYLAWWVTHISIGPLSLSDLLCKKVPQRCIAASLVTAIAGGAVLARQGINNDQKVNIIRNLIKASYIFSLASTVVSIIGILVSYFTTDRSAKKTLFLLSYSIPLLIVGIYRVVSASMPRTGMIQCAPC